MDFNMNGNVESLPLWKSVIKSSILVVKVNKDFDINKLTSLLKPKALCTMKSEVYIGEENDF